METAQVLIQMLVFSCFVNCNSLLVTAPATKPLQVVQNKFACLVLKPKFSPIIPLLYLLCWLHVTGAGLQGGEEKGSSLPSSRDHALYSRPTTATPLPLGDWLHCRSADSVVAHLSPECNLFWPCSSGMKSSLTAESVPISHSRGKTQTTPRHPMPALTYDDIISKSKKKKSYSQNRCKGEISEKT